MKKIELHRKNWEMNQAVKTLCIAPKDTHIILEPMRRGVSLYAVYHGGDAIAWFKTRENAQNFIKMANRK